MTSRRTGRAPHVPAGLTPYLGQPQQASPQTIARDRDTVRLCCTCVKPTTGREPAARQMSDLDAPLVRLLLDYLAPQRGPTVRARNMHLAALRTFRRFLALRAPESLAIATRGLAIPVKRAAKKRRGSLTRAADRSCGLGRRAHALLRPLDTSGARVSAVTTFCHPDTLPRVCSLVGLSAS